MQNPLPRLVDHELTILRDRGVVVQAVCDDAVLEILPGVVGCLLGRGGALVPSISAEEPAGSSGNDLVCSGFNRYNPSGNIILRGEDNDNWIDRDISSYSSGAFTERFMNEVKVIEASTPQPIDSGFKAYELLGMGIHNAAGVSTLYDWPEEGLSIWNPTYASHIGNVFGVEMYESDKPSITGVVS